MKKYYGVTVLVDILRGAKNRRIISVELDKLSKYGALPNISREKLETIIEWLIDNHFILKTKGQYPVLHPTYDGLHYNEKITQPMLKKLLKALDEK